MQCCSVCALTFPRIEHYRSGGERENSMKAGDAGHGGPSKYPSTYRVVPTLVANLIRAWRIRKGVDELTVVKGSTWKIRDDKILLSSNFISVQMVFVYSASSTVRAALLKYRSKHFIESPPERNAAKSPPVAPSPSWYGTKNLRLETGSSNLPFPKAKSSKNSSTASRRERSHSSVPLALLNRRHY